jgi:hypothetical protein
VAGRIYTASKCIGYEKSRLHDKPAIKVELKNLKLEPYPNSVILTLDTGFEGSILLKDKVM